MSENENYERVVKILSHIVFIVALIVVSNMIYVIVKTYSNDLTTMIIFIVIFAICLYLLITSPIE
jgi:hypothetical protein